MFLFTDKASLGMVNAILSMFTTSTYEAETEL